MKTNCPICNKEFEINETMLGKKAKCSECQNIFLLWWKVEIIPEKKLEEKIEIEEIWNEKIEPKKISYTSSPQNITIKPNKISYILFSTWIFWFLIILLLLSVIASVFYTPIITVSIIIWIIIVLINFWLSNISYKKENYTFTPWKIIYTYGWLFSDNTVEININKISQVSCHIWFIENIFFKTGHITIKTAGSTSGKIKLRSVENTLAYYWEIQKRMQYNGFKLTKENLVMEAKPHIIGAFWESINWLITNILVIVYVVFNIIWELWNSANSTDLNISWVWWMIIGWVFFVIAIPIVIRIIFKYLDVKKRIYQIYDDGIYFSEGFLSKNYSFLPMENVSDTENNQSFFSKIFWIHDVIVSSEWSNNQVYFYNMVNGKKMMETIKYLKQHISIQTKAKTDDEQITIENESWETIEMKITSTKNTQYNTDFTLILKPNILKIFLVNVPFILWVYTIPVFLINFFKAFFTTFHITSSNFEYKYEFISTKHNIFSVDKITKIVITESILDKWLGTCSIALSSIWSSNSMNFSNIKKTPELFDKVLSKIWIYKEEPQNIIPISYSVWELFKMNLFTSIILILATLPLLCIPLIWLILYYKYYFKEKYYKNTLYKSYIESLSGIIIQTKIYSHLDNIKAIEVIKYPFTNTGTLLFDISWDNKAQYGEKANQYSLISSGIKIPLTWECNEVFNTLDTILNNANLDTNIILEKKQDIWNTLLWVIPFSLITFIFAPLVIWITIWYIKSKKYILENSRILSYWGIIYKTKRSILYSKFDFIEQNQWFINKIFGNWMVSIFTKWSGFSDMKIIDIANHTEIYDILKEKVN